MMDLFSFEKDFYDRMKQLFNTPFNSYELKLWEDGKLIYDSTKSNKQIKPNNNAPKSIKGDYDLSIHGNTIVLVDNVDGTTVEAKCHPDDTFDIGEGIKEAFKKMNEKREEIRKEKEEEKKIKVGDWVEIVNDGASYSTKVGFFKENDILDYAGRFRYGVSPYVGTKGKVLYIEKEHDFSLGYQQKIAVVEVPRENYCGSPKFNHLDCCNAIYLVKIRGLKKVEEPND